MAGNRVHFELPATDTARAKAFWSSLLGWSFQEPFGGMEYHMADGTMPGGAIFLAEQAPVGHANIYFDTDDIDASLARVGELGGQAAAKQPIRASAGSRRAWTARGTRSRSSRATSR